MEICNPLPWKKFPLFPSNPPLKVEALSSPPLFENLVGGSTPSPLQKEGWVHTVIKFVWYNCRPRIFSNQKRKKFKSTGISITESLKVHQCRFENLPLCLCSYTNNTLKCFAFWIMRILELSAPWSFVNFWKSRLIFNIFCCFWMFVNTLFTYLTCAYLKK